MNGNNTDFGFGGIWGVIMLLIVAGLFGNGFSLGGGNANGITEEFLDNRLMARDTFNVNTNLLDTKYALGTEIINNRYQAQLGDCNLSKDIMQNSIKDIFCICSHIMKQNNRTLCKFRFWISERIRF